MADLLNVPRSTGDDLNHYYFLYLPFNLEDQVDSKGDNPFFIMNYKGDPSIAKKFQNGKHYERILFAVIYIWIKSAISKNHASGI